MKKEILTLLSLIYHTLYARLTIVKNISMNKSRKINVYIQIRVAKHLRWNIIQVAKILMYLVD